MFLWTQWYSAISLLRPAFSHNATFVWFIVCVAGLSVRSDNLGVSSIVRALSLDGDRDYFSLLRNIHSDAIDLTKLRSAWTQVVLKIFGDRIERVNGRIAVIVDGKKIAKSGKKMPAVKSLFQESESNTKPNYIMGHSTQAISILARAANTLFAVPLDIQIHEGVVFSNRDKRTLLDKLVSMVSGLSLPEACYLVADAYYAKGKIIKGMLTQGHDLVTRVRSDCVAYHSAKKPRGKVRRGRPKLYGKKVKLHNLFRSALKIDTLISPVYDERNVTLRVRTIDLLWKPAGHLVRFVLVEHPTRGRLVLMCTDLTLEPVEIIRLYGLRFKIELGFKQAAHLVGSYGYHFWMADMKPTRRGGGNQYMHCESEVYRKSVRRKLRAYHVFLFMGVVTQGLMHYLSTCHTQPVWQSFRSWLRTIRKGVAPTEMVVKIALRNELPEFLLVGAKTNPIAKFIVDHQAPDGGYYQDKAA
jgi:hypothetical protein